MSLVGVKPGHLLFAATQRVHFIGIGGIGMSGIAEILLTMGYAVSGSDLRRSRRRRSGWWGWGRASSRGMRRPMRSGVRCGGDELSGPGEDESGGAGGAGAQGMPVILRAEMLAELMRLKYGIAVAGMHGKTTTTSMVAAVLAGGGLDPTVVVGGRVDALGSNARLGNSQLPGGRGR